MRLLVLCQDPEGPVVRHRVRALLPHLVTEGFAHVDIRAIPKRLRERRGMRAEASGADLVLLVRKLFTRVELSLLRRASARLAFDVDDAVMFRDPRRGRATSRVRAARFRNTVCASDLVLAGNAHLLELTRNAAHAVVAPTPIDSARFVPAEPPAERIRRIGWIGSRSTLPYLRVIAEPLGRLLAARDDVVFCVMADARPDLPFDVDLTPWSEDAEVPWLHSLSAGVMPLTDDPWSRGKCGFKLLQYMACGVPAIASPVGANVAIADGGEAALLADDDETWLDALNRVLDDASLAARLRERGRAHVERHYAASVLGPRYAGALADCARGDRP